MKKALLFLMVLLTIESYSQDKAKLINKDTAFYKGKNYVVGDTIYLGYGSDSKKDFVFVFMGSDLTGWDPLQSSYKKKAIVIKSVFKRIGIIWFKALAIDDGITNLLGSNKVMVDIEGAIDNKELL